MDISLDEVYGIIGTVIAAVIAGLIRYRDKIFKIGDKEDKDDANTMINDKFNTQNKILDKGLENIIDSMSRLEEKVDYMHQNAEEKIVILRSDISKVDAKTEKLQDKLGDLINKFFTHVESHKKTR
jgi:predicted RNase H-like nuclease (RuvC/YqgF family)